MSNKPPCELCIKYLKKRGEEPDCLSCVPPLEEENELAVDIFLRVRNQLIFPPMGKYPLGIDQKVILKYIEMFDGNSDTLDKVLFLEKHFILDKR